MALHDNPARLREAQAFGVTSPGNGHAMDDQLLLAESGECAWPGLKSAPAIVDFVRGAPGKVDPAVFAVEERREGRGLVILGLRLDRAARQTGECFDDKGRAGVRKQWKKID